MNWPFKITLLFDSYTCTIILIILLCVRCRSVLKQRRHRSDHPIAELPAVRCRAQGVSGRGLGQDGALPLPVLDPTALHPLCPTRPLSAQSGGQVWCGPPASQVQGACYAQTRLGEKQVPATWRHAAVKRTDENIPLYNTC